MRYAAKSLPLLLALLSCGGTTPGGGDAGSGESGIDVDASSGVDCNKVETAPVLRACMQPLGEAADASTFGPADVDLSAHGKVMSSADGALAGGCMESVLKFETNGPALAKATKSLVIADGTRSWDAEYLMGGMNVPDLTGAMVDVAYHYHFGGFDPIERRLSVVSDGGASVYVGEAGDIGRLVGLPLQLTRGAAICATNDPCGNWQRYDINATSGTTATVVPHGGSGQVGDYVVVHGGYAEQTSSNTICADWFVADVHVGVVRAK